MKAFTRAWLLAFLILGLMCAPALGRQLHSFLVTPAQLRQAGVFSQGFRMVTLTDGGRLVGLERARPRDQRKGITYKLWDLELSRKGSLAKAHFVPLTVPRVEQIALAPDRKRVVIITHSGVTYLTVNLRTGAFKTIITDANGVGFRALPPMLLPSRGHLYTLGFRYNQAGPIGPRRLAVLHLSRRGMKALALGADVDRVQKSAGGHVALADWSGPDRGFLTVDDKPGQALKYWRRGQGMRVLDRAKSYTSVWGIGDIAVATALGPDGRSRALLLDAARHKKWLLGTSTSSFGYPHLSADGSVAIVCHLMVGKSRMSVFVARRDQGYRLRSIASLQEVPLGTLRLSPDGRLLAHFSRDGLRVVRLAP